MVSCKCVVVHCKYIELEASVDDEVYTCTLTTCCLVNGFRSYLVC